jgi:hypothetical protein
MVVGGGGNGSTMSVTLFSVAAPAANSSDTPVVSQEPLTSAMLGDLSTASAKQTVSSLYALINAQVTIPASGQTPATTYISPMRDTGTIKQFLPTVLDKLTTKKTANLTPRININTAPSAVLSALAPNGTPLLDTSTVQTIMSTRPSTSGDAPDPIFQTPAWLITEANLPVSTVQSLDQYITTVSQVYRIQSIGHFEGGGPTARVEAVIDVNAGRPRILYYRDLTGLGKGFNLPTNKQ